MRRKDLVDVDEVTGIEFRIPWRGLGHYHKAKRFQIEPICRWKGLLEDCPRTRRERKKGK